MMNRDKVRIGSRESALAMVQSRMVQSFLKEKYPDLSVEILGMKTTGDKILDKKLDQIGGKGLFVKELDAALLEKRTDLSVHSLKDLPMEVPQELPVLCYSKREDPRDVLVLPEGVTELDLSKPIGTSSNRRILQLQKLYPEAGFESVRGNLQTRLRKLDEGLYSGIILAAAGLKRLGMEDRISRYFEPDEVIPAAGQAILAVQGRDLKDRELLEGFADEDAKVMAECERAFVKALNGGCTSPIAGYSEIEGDLVVLRGFYVNEENGKEAVGKMSGNKDEAKMIGKLLAEKLKGMTE